MNIILGNLIENAIEAQEEVTDPRLELSLSFLNGSLIIDIKNSCSHEVKFSKGLPLTSKQPAEEHGYGIRNVKSILDKYWSSMFIDCSDGFFTVRIIMEINGSFRRKY